MRQKILAGIIVGLMAATIQAEQNGASASGSRINVLWWTYADPLSEYRTAITNLSGFVGTIPASSGLDWSLTFFDPTSPTPDFANYDVLVIESGEPFRTGPPGGPLADPDYSGILNNKSAIQAVRGDRTFLSGADADFHAVRGDTGNVPDSTGGVCSPALSARNCWDGALGHLVNAINWAGSGQGLGIVSLVAAEQSGSEWWLDPNSFLRDELNGFFTIFGAGPRENIVLIPGAAAAFPVSAGLTSLGLSDWDYSFHAGFSHSIPGYTTIVDGTGHPDSAVAIASSATAGGETDGDGIPSDIDTCPNRTNPDQLDSDGDAIGDVCDNCKLVANPTQLDADRDGYGNICDPDINNSGTVTSADFGLLRSVLSQAAGSSATAAASDMNGSGTVTSADFGLLRARLNTVPGPSGLACARTIPCP